MKLFTIFCILFIFIGCATVPPIPTPSGKPEITIPNVSKEKVANEIINNGANDGFILKSSNSHLVVLDKPINDGPLKYLFGSRENPTPNYRIQFQLTEVPTGIRCVMNIFIVTNPGTTFETIENWNKSKDAYLAYQSLEKLKNRFPK